MRISSLTKKARSPNLDKISKVLFEIVITKFSKIGNKIISVQVFVQVLGIQVYQRFRYFDHLLLTIDFLNKNQYFCSTSKTNQDAEYWKGTFFIAKVIREN